MKSKPPNPRLQRTRMRAPLSRKPFGDGRADRLVRVSLCLVYALLAFPGLARAGGDPFQGAILAEENSAPRGRLVAIAWMPVQLSLRDTERLRHVLQAARARGLKEEADSARTGRVPGGVPGCMSPDFRLTFTRAGESWPGVLHLSCGWFQSERDLGAAIVFSDLEQAVLRSVLRSGRS